MTQKARQITLFDIGPPPITAAMLRDLRKLEDARPAGLFREGLRFRDHIGRRIAKADASPLLNRGLARLDWNGRTPRLKITAAGTRALAAPESAR